MSCATVVRVPRQRVIARISAQRVDVRVPRQRVIVRVCTVPGSAVPQYLTLDGEYLPIEPGGWPTTVG